MPGVTRQGDACTGHGCWPPRNSTGGSPDVSVNGLPAHRVDDAWDAHTCPGIPETHGSVLAAGSASVCVNGKALGRIGDPIACGSTVVGGSTNVFAGG